MRFIFKTFLRGIAAALPMLITISILWWVIASTESFFRTILGFVLPERLYMPGLGIFLAVAAIFAIGLLTRSSIFTVLFRKFEDTISTVPIVKTIYGSVKDFFQLFFDKENKFSKVVLVSTEESDHMLVGFLTSENPDEFLGTPAADCVGVYLPMSYQIGGFTIFVPRKKIQPVDAKVEDALRYVLTAGVSHRNEKKKIRPGAKTKPPQVNII